MGKISRSMLFGQSPKVNPKMLAWGPDSGLSQLWTKGGLVLKLGKDNRYHGH